MRLQRWSLPLWWSVLLLLSGCLTAAGCGILEDHQHHHGSEVAGGVVQQRLNSFPAGAVSAATAAAVDGSRSSSSIKRAGQGFSQHRSLRRQLLHLEAMQSASSADALHAIDTAYTTATASTAALVNLYPREAAAVQQCLQDALSSGQGPKEIPVWFVVVSDPTLPSSNITQQQAEQQAQLLNAAFGTGLPGNPSSGTATRGSTVSEEAGATQGQQRQLWRFKLLGVQHIASSRPMCVGSKQEDEIRRQWHPQLLPQASSGAGGHAALVIYTTNLMSPACKGSLPGYKHLFGWSNTPMELQDFKQRQQGYKDGVLLDFRFLYSSGRTAQESTGSTEEAAQGAHAKALHGASTGAQLVHEVGHWMGLLHTFVGGCTSNPALTDGVDDTAPEGAPKSWGIDLGDASGGCKARDSCPRTPGSDPSDNFMDYNNLTCARGFTAGQQARMLHVFNSMRAARIDS